MEQPLICVDDYHVNSLFEISVGISYSHCDTFMPIILPLSATRTGMAAKMLRSVLLRPNIGRRTDNLVHSKSEISFSWNQMNFRRLRATQTGEKASAKTLERLHEVTSLAMRRAYITIDSSFVHAEVI
jgi:hypothetical protein